MSTWQRTDLSTDPGIIQMADTDRRAITIDAGEAITGATATIALYSDPNVELAGIIETPITVGAQDATLTISGLTRGNLYEVSVVFERADGTKWTKSLAIRCVL